MQRDSLDFKSMSVGKLFTKLLVPTIMGMAASALFTVVDGIFVGNGIGSDAMAAVNISAPIFMIITGVGLMFGMGGGILTSINLSQGKKKVANINFTQSVIALVFISLVMTLLLTIFPHKIATLFGSDEYLMDMVVEYLFWFSISLPFTVLVVALTFFIRLTNPKISMWAMLAATVVNIILDYLFIFVFKWGLFGAAIATDIGEFVGAAIMIVYLFRHSIAIRFVWLKLSVKSLLLTLRNVGYMIKLGFSVFLSEITISVMIISGNYVFMDYMGADGVAAYSVICYLFPIIFMVFNATVQSAQPIISYNFGAGQPDRVRKALHLAIRTALICGISFFIITFLCRQNIVSLFIDRSCPAFDIAVNGIPYFGVGFIFFAANMIGIGYYQSIGRGQRATIITLLRGVVFMLIGFFVLPLVLGVPGIWLAVPLAELLTTLYIIGIYFKDRFMVHRL